MNFHVLTLFPDMVRQGMDTSIMGRALAGGRITLNVVDIRDYTEDRHRKVDDYPYGGGAGMLMQAQPVYDAYMQVRKGIRGARPPRVIYVTPQGTCFEQRMAEELSREEDIVFLCGHYEGIDERVLEEIVTDYVSIGDYVLTGGELPAMVMTDAIARLIPGVLNNEDSAETESFHNCLLEYPQYSRPEEWHGRSVPRVLLSGNHRKIAEWRLEQAVFRTRERRPDLYGQYEKLMGCREYLKKQKLLHIGMIELINRGQAELLYCGPDGAFIRDKISGALMLTAGSKEAGESILERYGACYKRTAELFVTHQPYMDQPVKDMYGLRLMHECYQAVYTRGTPLREDRSVCIRPLEEDFTEQVAANYSTMDDTAYIRSRIRAGWMFGAFEDGQLAGFIGMHEEGSMGLLTVLDEYRRKGLGAALESFMINHMLRLGYIPYCQVYTDNQPSMELQRKLGLYFSKGTVTWYVK